MNSDRGKRAVVLGGAGFVGSHLCERLLAEGAEHVWRSTTCALARAEPRHRCRDSRFDFLERDVTEPFSLARSASTSSSTSPRRRRRVDYDRLWLETCVGSLGTERARAGEAKQARFPAGLDSARSTAIRLVHPQRESYFGNVDATGPRAVYDEAKRYGEAIVQAFRRKRGVSTRIVRIFNTYGPRMRLNDGRVVPAFVAQALRGEDFTIFGDGTQTRSFCYVDDLVDGLVRLALSNELDPVNLGNPDERRCSSSPRRCAGAAGAGGSIVFKPLPPGDPKQRKPDITRATTLLGWAPKVSLREGLERTLDVLPRARLTASRLCWGEMKRAEHLKEVPGPLRQVPRGAARRESRGLRLR
jgi:dTDP-glucose 4,6-dehydratase